MKPRYMLEARAGGTAVTGTGRAEATIWGVPNFIDARNMTKNSVRESAREILKVLKVTKEIVRK